MAKSTTTSKSTQTTKTTASKATASKAATVKSAPAKPTSKPAETKPAQASSPRVAKKGPASADAIAARAYQIWIEQGCPEGRDEENWIRAEKELNGK